MEAEFRQVLANLELLSNGRTQSFDGRVTGSKDRSPLMRLAEEPAHEVFARRWAEAGSEEGRATVLADAQATLRAAKRTPPPPRVLLEVGSLAWKRDIANDTKTSLGELARLNGISRQTVVRYRKLYRDDVRVLTSELDTE